MHIGRKIDRRWLALLASPYLASCGDGGNRLLGTWELMPGSLCTVERITFTPGNVTNVQGPNSYYAGQESTIPVYYRSDSPDRITVTTRDEATSVTYILSDDDHMHMGDRQECAYQRRG